jgi:hypothetical protein
MPLILAGVLVGATHVFVGPDHLAALAPFAVEARRKAWLIGLRWGVGHALGIVVVGLAGYAVIDWLDIELLSGLSERLIGLVLIVIGVWGLNHLRKTRLAYPEAGQAHEPLSVSRSGIEGHVHTRAAFLVGAVHGVAGTGNVLGILPAMAQPSWLYTGTYLASFGFGSILAMVGFAFLLGLAVPGQTPRGLSYYRWVFVGACAACLVLGVVLILFPTLRFHLHSGT